MKSLHYRCRISGILALLCLTLGLSAQNYMSSTVTRSDSAVMSSESFVAIFNAFSSETSTGYLADRSQLSVSPRLYSRNVLNDSTRMTPDKFGFMYYAMNMAAIAPAYDLPDPAVAYRNKMGLRYPDGTIQLCHHNWMICNAEI